LIGVGEGFYRYEDMACLKVQAPKNSSEDTWMVIGEILGVAALVFLISSYDSVSICSPSPCDKP